MRKGELGELAQMYALVARMEAIIATVAGMKAANDDRLPHHAQAYGEDDFYEMAGELNELAKQLEESI